MGSHCYRGHHDVGKGEGKCGGTALRCRRRRGCHVVASTRWVRERAEREGEGESKGTSSRGG